VKKNEHQDKKGICCDRRLG